VECPSLQDTADGRKVVVMPHTERVPDMCTVGVVMLCPLVKDFSLFDKLLRNGFRLVVS
jgi:hypothetical protein